MEETTVAEVCEFCDGDGCASCGREEAMRAEVTREREKLEKKPAPPPAPAANGLRCSVLQENLRAALAVVVRAVATRSTLPITACVLISSDNGRLRLQCTDLELTVTAWCGALIESEGAVAVDARYFAECINALGPVSLALDASGPRMAVKGGRAEHTFNTMKAEDFPSGAPFIGGESWETIPAAEMRAVGKRVVPAAASDGSRPVLTGVGYASDQDENRTWVAADGFRLAVLGGRMPVQCIVPARALRTVAALVGSEDVRCSTSTPGTRIAFRFGDIEVVTQIIQGTYPNYQQLIPEETAAEWVVEADDLKRSLGPVLPAARHGSKIVRFRATENRVRVWTTGDDALGTAEGELEVEARGDDAHVALNAAYAQEAVDAFAGETVTIGLNGPSQQVTFRVDGYTHVVMPMFVQGWDS
ncbi:MAG: DNA polymerase III subunit beta [Vicinamibacterales bacterium]